MRGIGELRQEREKEYRHLGIGQIHDDAAAIQLTQTDGTALVGTQVRLTGSKSLPGEIQQIPRADDLQHRESQHRRLKDCRNSEGHCRSVDEQARAQSRGNDKARQTAIQRRLRQHKNVIRTRRQTQHNRCAKEEQDYLGWDHGVYPFASRAHSTMSRSRLPPPDGAHSAHGGPG